MTSTSRCPESTQELRASRLALPIGRSSVLPRTRAGAERHLIANGASPSIVATAETLTLAVGGQARRYARDGATEDVDLELGVVRREITAASTHCAECDTIGVTDDGRCPACRARAIRRARILRYGLSCSRATTGWRR